MIPEGETDPVMKHIRGENLFLRAFAHLMLSEIFAYPYAFGRENPGIVIRTAPMTDTPVRASVGDV